MIPERRLELLHQVLPDLDQQWLDYVARSAREVTPAPGDCICQEGETGDEFYIIAAGRVRVTKFLEFGTERVLNELGPGQFFGEMALVEDAPRVASVYAIEPTTLLALNKQDFQNLITHSAAVGLAVMRAVTHRFRDADRHAIDELRQKNAELARAYADLAETTRRKSEFLTVVSHELRTPLTSIKGYAQLMHMGKLDAALLPIALDAIVSNTDALVRLINNILFLQELDLIPPTFEAVDVAELILPIVESLRPGASDNQLSFKVTLPASLPPVRGDRNGLMQAISALLDNAIKYSPDGGEIQVAAQVNHRKLALSITDPGVGIPADELDHIFDRFHHVESTQAHLFGGVGLGLPIARQVVEQHGGEISVVSEVDKGSTFTISLPLADASR